MKLRGKTLAIIVFIILMITISFFVISQTIFTGSSTETENQYTHMVLNNTLHALNNDLATLNNTANDWSQYDNAYDYVSGNNPNFIERSLLDATFLRLNLNLIIFTDSNGRILFAKAIDLESGKEISLSENLNNELSSLNLTQNTDESGFVSINGTPMIIVSKPVLKSGGEGPSQGTLIMGRFLNERELESLSENVNISINSFSDSNLPIELENAKLNLNNAPAYINTLNSDTVAGYSLLNGISGLPSLIVKVEIPRMIYKTYEKAIFYLTLSIIIIGGIAALLVYYHLDKILLYRLDQITSSIIDIRKSNNLKRRVPVLGNDELADLAISVNEMLLSLHKSNLELEKSEESYRTIFENTGTAMLMVDKDMNIILANTEFEHIFGLDGKNLMNFVVESHKENIKEYTDAMKVSAQNTLQSYEFQLYNKNGDVKDFLTTFGFISGTSETLISFIDVTEHNNAVKNIKNSLKEKEILLREIHHRVKNNLQIIAALLMLQAEESGNQELLSKYKESENRIHVMALIHERIYQSKNLSNINFADYIQSLIDDLIYSYGFNSNQLDINIDSSDFNLSIETVMPLGLIINELVSNSLKYAFEGLKEGTPKKLGISLKLTDKNIFILEVSDNGVGIPNEFNFENTTSLGLLLVKELIKQLDGELEVIRGHGTRFIISFQEPEYQKRI